ncbi:MAG: hypothetical protein FWD01_03270, partial [Defluviitaleaceae bacterium]|nr:hypothetical protein [Defluviitaleaceae bacterium]
SPPTITDNDIPVVNFRTLQLAPPVSREGNYELALRRRLETGVLEMEFSRLITPIDQMPVSVTVQGVGIVEFVMFVDGSPVGSEWVDFND